MNNDNNTDVTLVNTDIEDVTVDTQVKETVSTPPTSTPTNTSGSGNNNDNKKNKKHGSIIPFLLVGVIGFGAGIGSSGFFKDDNNEAVIEEPAAEASSSTDKPYVNYADDKQTEGNSTEHTIPTNKVEEVTNSVVSIEVDITSTAEFLGQKVQQEGTASGSGVIIAEDSDKIYIVTNNHVIEGANSATIRIDDDDTGVAARFVGTEPSSDLAIVYVLKSDLAAAGMDNYTIATVGDSDSMQLGDEVYVIGNAAGEGKSVSKGIISAVNRDVQIDEDTTIEAFQTDASINPGNSGGALVNSSGELVGINFAKLSSAGSANSASIEGMGFSIPINYAGDVLETIMDNDVSNKPYLGIQGGTLTDELRQHFDVNYEGEGVLVTSVYPEGGADTAGIEVYDVITAVDGVEIKDMDALSEELKKYNAEDTVEITLYRDNKPVNVSVTLSSYSDISKF